MTFAPVIVSLPIADRATSHRFYRDALGLEAVGELADDGIPEPLQFVVNDGLRLMLIPTGGFGWVVGGHEVAARGQSECLLSLGVTAPADADAIVERARAAGAEVVTEPEAQPWGYAGTFADPDGHLWMVSVEPAS
ncbi:VOC family protein [Micromonospora sp. RHAY321]|uniref:VOC family protein n=1 Tax=Micromonospora sp. RHAY321 TaxID=2944807 RepID=UPI00207D2F34|nr:VOC family protein [Micromonospora sp. RHAY321]MCO1595503.1 VOC family protein [Micromonospora sp. RHAY321]